MRVLRAAGGVHELRIQRQSDHPAAAAFDFTFLADKANQKYLIQVLENHVVVPGIDSYAALEAAANST